jgi:hypothetical protein
MKRSSQRRPDDWAALGELDAIVDRLFDDLDSAGPTVRRADRAMGPAAAASRAGRRTADGPPTDSDEAMSSLPRSPAVSEDVDKIAEREAASDEAEPATQARPLAPEEADFIAHAVDWLAPRSNAELLLERIRWSLSEQDAGAEHRAPPDASDPAALPPDPKNGS